MDDIKTLNTEFTITLDVLSAMSVIGAIQLATRNPKWDGGSRAVAIAFAQELTERVSGIAPSYGVILEMGWSPLYDL
jgi:hypothetical protein